MVLPVTNGSRDVQVNYALRSRRIDKIPYHKASTISEPAEAQRGRTYITSELGQVTLRNSQIKRQFQRRVLIFDHKAGAIYNVCWREIWTPILTLLIIDALGRSES